MGWIGGHDDTCFVGGECGQVGEFVGDADVGDEDQGSGGGWGETGEGDAGEIVVIGVGGISSGSTLKHFMDVGAVAGEVGTALGVEGVEIFEKIFKEAGLQ